MARGTRRKPPVMRLLSRKETLREDRDARFFELWEALGGEEREILIRLAGRLLEGQRVYGLLDLARDDRDIEVEQSNELADYLVWGAMAELRRVLRLRRETSHAALRQLAKRAGRG